MVRTRLPEGLVALHPLITDQDVLHGVVQGVTHMELACDIGRRHYDGKGLLPFPLSSLCIGMEIFIVQPFLVQTVLNDRRIIGLFQFFHN